MGGTLGLKRHIKSALGLVLACLLWGGDAWGHSQSQGQSHIVVEGNVVRVDVYLQAADWQALLALDPNEDGMVEAAELEQGDAALRAFMPQTLRILSVHPDGTEVFCPGVVTGMDVLAAVGSPPLFPVGMRFECALPPEQLRVRFGLFTGSPVRHINVATVELPGRREQLLFTPDTRDALITVNVARPLGQVAWEFWLLGLEHILTGYDHLLFLLTLLLLAQGFRQVLGVVTAFTVAHSVTLGMAALGVASLPGSVVEPVIAASIVWVAVDDLWVLAKGTVPKVPRWSLAFLFGLVHGFGFAGALETVGLPRNGLLLALGMFNVGVESGQLVCCALALAALAQVEKRGWKKPVAQVLAAGAAVAGTVWCVMRVVG